ncbi:hypothetical protein CRG98_035918 [Punica granatum]|uniref:Uncharacterized protein n=1 Tax=Punica granatum TaxID=22663 RepID=A0A2I0II81_PUNGR|nr:hypothetical protein CRG98_035918 [Punica granatum]
MKIKIFWGWRVPPAATSPPPRLLVAFEAVSDLEREGVATGDLRGGGVIVDNWDLSILVEGSLAGGQPSLSKVASGHRNHKRPQRQRGCRPLPPPPEFILFLPTGGQQKKKKEAETVRLGYTNGKGHSVWLGPLFNSLRVSRDNGREGGIAKTGSSVVCKRWQSATTSIRTVNQSPWIMYFPERGNLCYFYDPSHREAYSRELPELQESREIRPAIVAISTRQSGATEWTRVNYSSRLPFGSTMWNRLVFSNGVFYCLCPKGWLGVFDPKERTWGVLVTPPKCPNDLFARNSWKGKFMAVHNKGDILVVYTCCRQNQHVFRLDRRNSR